MRQGKLFANKQPYSKLINVLNGRPERRLLFEKEIEGQGLSSTFDIEVWDGIHDSRSVVRSINLGHKKIVRNAQLMGYESVIICEDDIHFTNPKSIEYFNKHRPEEFDLWLGVIYLGDIKEDNTVDEFCGMIFYEVHSRFYDTFLSVPEDQHIDRAMKGLGKFVVCNPMVCKQLDNIFSSNTGKIEDYSWQLRNYKFL